MLEAHHARTAAHLAELQAALRLIEQKQAYYLKWLENERRPGEFTVGRPPPGRDRAARAYDPCTTFVG